MISHCPQAAMIFWHTVLAIFVEGHPGNIPVSLVEIGPFVSMELSK